LDNGEALPLDVAFVLRKGRDLTLMSWGAMVKETLAAAEVLAEEGIETEVIDLATLKPYDEETVLASVAKTGRCVIVHEAARTGGVDAEIAALTNGMLSRAGRGGVARWCRRKCFGSKTL
jgi:pyruvate dehydrogenase E1 component beta subunit